MSIKITSDSTSDLSPALLEQYDITVLPLYVTMGEQTCRDGVDARPEDLFAYVERTGSLPTTAAVNVADYHDCFAQFSPGMRRSSTSPSAATSPPATKTPA